MIQPNLDLILTKPVLRDRDRYDAVNRDGTYYKHDPMTILAEPVYKFQNERYKHLTINMTKQYEDQGVKCEVGTGCHHIPVQTVFKCDEGGCTERIDNSDLWPYEFSMDYGDDKTIYNATDDSWLGSHGFHYDIELYNLGRNNETDPYRENRMLNKTDDTTDTLAVVYEPQYPQYHPYLALSDGEDWSWDNRNGIAMVYNGSRGSGPDDVDVIHPDRRSKINGFLAEGAAFRSDPDRPFPLAANMTWSDAEEYANQNDCTVEAVPQDVFESLAPHTANFVSNGTGKIRFDLPIAGEMRNSTYQNATISNVLRSLDFAGVNSTDLFNYTYSYPDMKFGAKVFLTTSDRDGERTDEWVEIEMRPQTTDNGNEKAMFTQDYVCEKIKQLTEDPTIANIIVSDMYGKEYAANGTGYAEIELKKVSTWFTDLHLAHAGDGDYLNYTLNEGLDGAASPYIVTLTVGGQTKTFPVMVYFNKDFGYVANTDQDNLLNITSGRNAIAVRVADYFGPITSITQDGEDIGPAGHLCGTACALPIPTSNTTFEAFNEWGGRAIPSGGEEYSPPPRAPGKQLPNINWDYVWLLVVLAGATYAIYRILKRAKIQVMD